MKLKFVADFDNLDEMLNFTDKLGEGSAGTTLQTVLDRINKMANQEVAGVIANMQSGFATLNEAQARSTAALDRVLGDLADMPARIQAAVDAATANGVDAAQLGELTALVATVQSEVDEAQAEATRLEAVSPVPVTPNPNPNPNPPADGGTPAPVTPTDGGTDTTGGGAPVPTPGA